MTLCQLSTAFVVFAKPDVAKSFWFHSERGIEFFGSRLIFFMQLDPNYRQSSSILAILPTLLSCDCIQFVFPRLYFGASFLFFFESQ